MYAYPEERVIREHKESRQKLQETRKQLKYAKEKLKRRDNTITKLLEEVKGLIGNDQYDLLKLNFDDETLVLFDNEIQQRDKNPTAFRYSEKLKKFAVTVHFYSAQAYEYLRKYLHLPHSSTIRKWCASVNCQPGYLSEVLEFLKKAAEVKPHMKDCVLMFDAMAIKQEIVYDQKEQKYVGFTDCGTIEGECADEVASEALVFLVSGLTGHWKYPIAYFLEDHLSAQTQAQMVKEGIAMLTEAQYEVHATVCDGSYTNQSTASMLGCSLIPGVFRHSFPHPTDKEKSVLFIFDACHQIKNVRNCLADLGILLHDGKPIMWRYIEELHKVQLKDNLHLANKLKSKHVYFQQHKMNVKLAVQALSASVADAIDFLREDMKMPQFQGSEETTKFIRLMDQVFDILNSKNPVGRGFKSPITAANLDLKSNALQKAEDYILKLTDVKGKKLTTGKRKTAWVGLICTMKSVRALSQHLLFRPERSFKYVLTYKLSQDHLEMLFSRVRRRGGWNNNPNCLQLKWSLRAILLKNGITPSKNANCIDITVEEPNNMLFQKVPSKASLTSQAKMVEFAKLLARPTEWHDQVLNYMAGYIAKHVVQVGMIKLKNRKLTLRINLCHFSIKL